MDVLKPELIWVDGRCYRFCDSNSWTNENNLDMYLEDDYQAGYTDEEACDFNIETVPYEDTKFKHSFHVPKAFFPFIIGSKNAVRKRIEIETKTTIQVPKQDGDIVIIGSDRRGILSARHRIDLLVSVSRKKFTFTHFLSIPLNTDEVVANFNSFKSDVIKKFGGVVRGIDEYLFQEPHKLHLTLGMLTLLDDEERKEAAQTLRDCKEHIIDPFIQKHDQIIITLKGLEYMNDDPSAIRILYATVITPNNILQTLADDIAEYFAEKGLIEDKTVKLHATFMNVYYRDKINNTNKNMEKTFDATQLLSEYKHTTFGTVFLNEIHLSQRKSSTTTYYQPTAKIKLYTN